jgi:hypothetical protein
MTNPVENKKHSSHLLAVGGGNSTHCLAPLICAAGINYTCNILTRRPEDWAEVIEMTNEDQGWMRVDSIKGR